MIQPPGLVPDGHRVGDVALQFVERAHAGEEVRGHGAQFFVEDLPAVEHFVEAELVEGGGVVVAPLPDRRPVEHLALAGGALKPQPRAVCVDVVVTQRGDDGVGGGVVAQNDHPVEHLPQRTAVLPVFWLEHARVLAEVLRGDGNVRIQRQLPGHDIFQRAKEQRHLDGRGRHHARFGAQRGDDFACGQIDSVQGAFRRKGVEDGREFCL